MDKQNTKLTNGQLLRRLKNAVVHIDKDKSYQSVYWSDKGLRLETTDEYCVISTGFHRHVFNAFNSAQGISRPYLYTKRVIEIANDNLKDIEVDGGYSFQKLLEVLKAKEDKTEYNIVTYVSWWFEIIFAPLYSIDESEAGSFLVYEAYLHHIARNSFLLDEHKEDVTNKQFVEKVLELEKSFLEGVEESVILQAKTDEQRVEEEVAAMQEQNLEQGT